MHIVTRAFAVLATSAALTLSALPPTQAGTPRATFGDRLGELAQVESAVPLSASPTGAVRKGAVPIETAGGGALALDLPARGATAKKADGRYHLAGRGGAALAVTPTSTGTQVLIGIDSAAAPATYDFGLRGDVSPRPAPDGGVDLVGPDGSLVAQVEAPWAVDAAGRHVPTRYELRGSTIRQVVDHQTRSVAYPVVADPKLKFCDLGTAVCVKLSKKETKKAHDAMFVSLGAGVAVRADPGEEPRRGRGEGGLRRRRGRLLLQAARGVQEGQEGRKVCRAEVQDRRGGGRRRKGREVLSRIDVLAYLVLAVALVALVLLLTDRSAFAWALAGAGFVGVLTGDLALRALRRRSRR